MLVVCVREGVIRMCVGGQHVEFIADSRVCSHD
jgi:hypothetical protein